MATTSHKQTIGHAEVRPDIQAPGLVSYASPTALSVPRIQPDLTAARNAERMARAAEGLAGSLGKIAIQNSEKYRDRQYLLGKQSRVKSGQSDVEQYQKDNGIKLNRWAIKGYNEASGAADAARDSLALKHLLDTEGDTLQSHDQLNEVFQTTFDKTLKGNTNAEYADGYFSVMQSAEAKLRAEWQQNKWVRNQAVARADFNAGNLALLQNAADNDESGQDIHTLMRNQQELGRMMGLSNTEIAEMQFQNLREIAVATGKDYLLADDGPLSYTNQDVDNPEQVIPAWTDSPEGREKILDARAEVLRAKNARKQEKDKEAELYARMNVDQLMQDRNHRGVINAAIAGVKDGTLPPSWAAEQIDKARGALRQDGRIAEAAVFAGTPEFERRVQLLPEGDRKEMQRRMDEEMLKKVPQNPEEMATYLVRMADNSKALGVNSDYLETAMNQRIDQAYPVYQTIAANRPDLIPELVKDEQLNKLRAIDWAVRERGLSVEQGIGLIQTRGQDGYLQNISRELKDSKTWRNDVNDDVVGALQNEKDWWPDSDAEIGNIAYVQQLAQESYRNYRTTYGWGHEETIKAVKEDFERNWIYVEYGGDAEGGRMVYHGNKYQDPMEIRKANDWFSDSMRAKVEKAGGLPADRYMALNNPMQPRDDRKMVYEINGSNIQPYLDAKGNPVYVGQQQLVTSYGDDVRVKKLKELEEENLQRRAEEALQPSISGGRNAADTGEFTDIFGTERARASVEAQQKQAQEQVIPINNPFKRKRKRNR